MSILTRPIFEINLKNLLKNYQTLQKIAPHAIAAAVVKDDAYGLGAYRVAQYLYDKGGCRCFFVAHGVEGEIVRKVAPEAQIYVLQGIGEDSLESFKSSNLIPVISSLEMLEFWKKNRFSDMKAMINIETGLNRLGFREKELEALSPEDKNLFDCVMSHLACGDEKDHFMNAHQLSNFKRLKKKFFPNLRASLSASDGTFLGEDFQFDIVRLGAALYGINTAPYRENQMLPVVTLKAPVLHAKSPLFPSGMATGCHALFLMLEKSFSRAEKNCLKRALLGVFLWIILFVMLPIFPILSLGNMPFCSMIFIPLMTWGAMPELSAMKSCLVSAKILARF